jgi:hypothetical protein
MLSSDELDITHVGASRCRVLVPLIGPQFTPFGKSKTESAFVWGGNLLYLFV